MPTSECETIINERNKSSSVDCRIKMYKPRILVVSGYHGQEIGKNLHYPSHKFSIEQNSIEPSENVGSVFYIQN